MSHDPSTPAPEPIDPASLKDAHGRTGKMFQAAGLPFDDDEFEDGDDESSSSEDSSSSSDEDGDPPIAEVDVKPAVDDVTSLDRDEGAGD